MKQPSQCLECGGRMQTTRDGPHVFCSSGCRKSFNNRRMRRGAQLYDLFMAMRHERKEAEGERVWSALCRLAAEWRSEDDDQRGGRKSWGDWRKILRLNPHLKGMRSTL